MPRILAAVLALLALPFTANAQWQFNGVPVSTAANYQVDPIIVTDGAGGAIIAWFDYRSGTNYDIYAQRLNAAGVPQWTTDGVPICTQPGNQITISMVSDDAGGAIIVWQDARNNIQTGLDIFAQRVNGSGAVLWTADGVQVCGAAGDQSEPVIIKSGAQYVVTWFDYRSGNADIYVQALNSSGAWQWVDPDGVALCTAAGNQFHPQPAGDGSGGAVVTWEDRRSGIDIYARRVTSTGLVQWAAGGVVVCNAVNDQYTPQIVGDGAAGGIIAWYDWRSGTPDIYMQRIDQTGAALWTANGTPICTAPGTQDSPSLVQDAGGGATVVWSDKRNGSNFDIYAQHVNSSGVPYFAADGVAVCTAGGNQVYPRITRDPASAGIVVWFDYRSGNPDIYAQRLDYLTGASMWTGNGVVLCTQPNLQEFPNAVSDGAGGAIVTWRDLREGNYYDVYAERVNGTPTPVGHTPLASSLRVLPNHPNPFTDATTVELVLPSTSDVEISVYDVAGRRVASQRIANARAGSHSVLIPSRASNGAPLPSGVYFYRVRAGAETVTKKMIIAR